MLHDPPRRPHGYEAAFQIHVKLPKAYEIAMLARFLRSLDKKFKNLLRTKVAPWS
jgi:hypothetical protein